MRRHIYKSFGCNRRTGTAPLEFVLAMPLFVLLILGLYALGGAVLYRLTSIERTRMATWHELPEVQPEEQLTLYEPVLDGAAENMTTIPYRFAGKLGGTFDATSWTASISGTWDQQTVPFRDRVPAYQGHVAPANRIAESWQEATGVGAAMRIMSVQMRRLQAKVALW